MPTLYHRRWLVPLILLQAVAAYRRKRGMLHYRTSHIKRQFTGEEKMGYALATQPAQLSGYIPPTITVVIPVIDALNFPPLWFASIPLWVDEVLLVVAERGTAAGNELIALLPPQVRIVQ